MIFTYGHKCIISEWNLVRISSSEKCDIKAGFIIPDCNIVLSNSSEKYDIKAGFYNSRL
jgi:hypothetical protein